MDENTPFAIDVRKRSVKAREDPKAIKPAARFAGRFDPRDLKEFRKNIGQWADQADSPDSPEKLDLWMHAAWERYKQGERSQGLKGVAYTAPSVDDVVAHMEKARRERETAGAPYEDPAEVLQRKNTSAKTGKDREDLAARTDRAMKAPPGGAAFPLPPRELQDFFANLRGSWEWTIADLALRHTLETGDLNVLRQGIEETLRYGYAGRGLHRRAEDMPTHLVLEHSSRPERSLIFDHGLYRGQLLRAYACGRPDLGQRFFPREIGPSTAGGDDYGRLMINLCMAIMYDDAERKTAALESAAAYRKRTKAVYERAFVEYFAALAEHDSDTMSKCLATLAEGAPKLMWFRDLTNKRIFNTELHGMYAFAATHLPEDVFRRVTRPDAVWWWDEYADMIVGAIRNGSNASTSAPLYPFSGETAFVNAMLCAIDYTRKPVRDVPDEESPSAARQTGESSQASPEENAGSGLWSSLKGIFRKK